MKRCTIAIIFFFFHLVLLLFSKRPPLHTRTYCFLVQLFCLMMRVSGPKVCVHSCATDWRNMWRHKESFFIVHTCTLELPHGSAHTRPWYRVVRNSSPLFIVPLHVCSAVFTDHSPHRSIGSRVSAASMSNHLHPRHLLLHIWQRIPILSGQRLKSRWIYRRR